MGRKAVDCTEWELLSIENELRQRLTRALPNVSEGRNSLFFVTDEHNPHDLPGHMLPRESAEILELARKSIALRDTLIMPTNRSIGALFIAACEEHANLDNPHRLGAKRLAARLLSQISRE